ncbi:hypothetical protein RJ639_035902 [Escallonia herrerae]|uniref:HTH OST-type domain-containing protein n=1 Tax=Escallonia herrerae TaxID=1293975 RepID=A0AA89B8I0_9ASTE|nr:hypothetical protein RJ639_035902 [Escallonia herrerae]
MKPVSSRTIISFISRSVNISKIPLNGHFEIAHFSTSPSQFHSFPSSSYPSRRHEEESRNVKVSVWWDFENCSLPFDMNAFRVAQSITAAIRTNGIKGPIQITAFGDVFQLSRRNQEALSSTGINITHIPHGGKNSADRSLLVDLMYWVSQNPPPAHLFLISGDRDFASILHRLRMNNYNILLASPDSAPGVLCSASSIMWQWNALVKGENLTGKHFNQPPDGPYGSWYGHYKAPLEDPFASTEAPACPRVEEQSESVAEPKLRPVPMVVMKQILKILKAYPKGISITDFRSELGKSNVSIDKDLYGYKKFSRFLFSMPHILKIQTEANGQFFLRGAAPKVPEPGESNLGISTGCTTNTGDPAEPAPALSPKINDGDASCRSTVHEKPSTSLDAKVNAKEPVKKVQGTSKRREDKAPKVPDPPPIFDNMRKAEATGSHMQPMDNQEPISELGFFSRVWRKWFGGKDSSSEQKTCGKPENCSMLSQKPEKSKETNEKCVKSAASCADPGGPVSFPTYRNENINDENIIRNSELNGGKSEEGPGYFSQIINWCKFWRSREKGENPSEEEESRKGNQIDIDAEKQEIFTRESFWNDVASFIEAPKGSNLIFQSRTRKKEGDVYMYLTINITWKGMLQGEKSKIPYEALVSKTHKPLYKCQNNVGTIILIKVELEMVRVGWRTRCSTLVLC